MRATLFLTTTVALALTMSAAADHCEGGLVAQPEVDTGHTTAGRYYVDNDLCQLECLSSVWIYQESNGIDGLQRGDAAVDDTCHGWLRADTLVHGAYT